MNELHNVAIFIDYENVYKTLLPNEKNLLRMGFFENLREWCKQQGQRVVKIVSYCNYDNLDLYESYHQTKLQEYGIETIHTSNRGKNYADLQLTIDVLNLMYLNNNIDEFIIISNDKDMSPLINTIKANKRKVALITANNSYDSLLENIADEIYQISDICKAGSKIKLKITENEVSILTIFNSYCLDKVEKATNSREFKHSEIDFLLNTYMRKFNIMKYEVANILMDFVRKDYILPYKYIYNGREYKALISKAGKDIALSKGLISECDFEIVFDCDKFVSEIYKNYIKKDS